MKKVIAIAVIILIGGFVLFINIQEDLIVKLQPDKTTLPENIEREIPNLYIEEQKGPRPYSYIFDPKEYGTNNEVYILIALGDIAMDFRIDEKNMVVELIPLVYPHLNDEESIWDSKNYGDDSESLSYRFTLHKVKIENANKYEYKFVLADDPRAEFHRWKGGNARSASDLPKPMKKR
jgi:hypothetical protein